MKILSIDAWRDPDGGWNWNNWHTVGEIDKKTFESIDTVRKTLRFFREEGYVSKHSAGMLEIDDDGYNVTVCARGTGEPLVAIEYGSEY